MVIDHTSFSVSDVDGDHTLIAADDLVKSDVLLGKTKIEVTSHLSSSFRFGLGFRRMYENLGCSVLAASGWDTFILCLFFWITGSRAL